MAPITGRHQSMTVSAATIAAPEITPARRLRRWYRAALLSFMPTPSPLVQLQRNQLRDAGFLHGHAVETVGDLHRLPVVRDEDELGVVVHPLQHLDEPPDVRIVQRSVDFVQQ